jgi:hypothetical protein
VSSLSSAASLIVAAFDLLAVRAVTGAARAADLESGDVLTPSGIVEKPEQAPTLDPDTYVSDVRAHARTIIVRQPCYCRPCQFPSRWRNPAIKGPLPRAVAPVCDVAPDPTCVTTNPIEPPWKILPWMDQPQQRVVFVKEIKHIVVGSDMSQRGKMLDLVV